jgi:hypothetical protein
MFFFYVAHPLPPTFWPRAVLQCYDRIYRTNSIDVTSIAAGESYLSEA